MNRIFITFLSLLSVFFLTAQESSVDDGKEFYFTVKGGFTFPVAKSNIGSPRAEVGSSILKIDNGDLSNTAPFGSRGAGGTVAASFGYMFHENFGAEMEFSFLRSIKILDASQNRDGYNAEQHSYTNMLRMSPMLVVMGNKDMKVRPYAKFGLLLPMAGKTIAELSFDDSTGELADFLTPVIDPTTYDFIKQRMAEKELDLPIPTVSTIKAKTGAHFSVGFTARIGAEYKVNDRIGLFGEMEMNMLTIKAKDTEITEFYAGVPEPLASLAQELLVEEGENIILKTDYYLEDIPEILRLTIYENEITEDSNASLDRNASTYNRDNPYQQLTFRDNYNSFGFMIGMRYTFGK